MTSDLLQQLTGIATLLTAVAALLTILEMRLERTAGYRPALAIDDQPVNLYRPVKGEWGHTVIFQPVDKLPSRDALPHGGIRFRVRGEQDYFEASGWYRVAATVSTNLSVSVSSDLRQY